MCIPSNSSDFIVSISQSLAQSEVHLTLEFLNEAFVGFLKSNEPMRQLCLDYMVPWLKNLAVFARHSPDDHKKNLSKTKDVLRLLIDLTVKRVEVMTPLTSFQIKKILTKYFLTSCISIYKQEYGRHLQSLTISSIL